jgi:hypothetical protein
MAKSKLPTKNILIISLFGGGIIFFVLLSIFPNFITYRGIENDINVLKNQIEEQKILSPIFSDLSDKARFEYPESLPFPEKEKLSKNETINISAVIQNIVLQNDFTLNNIFTDVGGLMDGSGILKMRVDITGDFLNLRNLMLQIGALPYLEHIENIRIDNTSGAQKILLKLWIAQET